MMILPFLLAFCAFTVVPVMSSVVLSLTDFNLIQAPGFVGFNNYIRLFLEDSVFIKSLTNTFVFALATGPLSYFLSLFLAWFINDMGKRARMTFTFLFYLPSLSAAMFSIWGLLFSGDIYGWVNGVLINMGAIHEPIAWLKDPRYIMGVVMLVQVWMSMGAGFLAFVAGLQSIDRTLYECGAIDGIRNRWQEFYHITLPSMGPQLLFGAVMQISASFAAGYICIALAGNPSTDYVANTIVTHLIDYGTVRYEMGYASAIATVLFVIMVFINTVIRRILRNSI